MDEQWDEAMTPWRKLARPAAALGVRGLVRKGSR